MDEHVSLSSCLILAIAILASNICRISYCGIYIRLTHWVTDPMQGAQDHMVSSNYSGHSDLALLDICVVISIVAVVCHDYNIMLKVRLTERVG